MSRLFIFEEVFTVAFRKVQKPFYSRQNHCLGRILTSSFLYPSRVISSTSVFNGVLTTKWTKQALISLSPLSSQGIVRRSYQRDNNVPINIAKLWRKRIWTVVRGVFLTTGALVWFVTIVAYFSLDRISVNVHEERGELGLSALEKKLMSNFYNDKDEAVIIKKDDALDRVWRKLKEEDRILEIFGDPVYICGYSYSDKIGKEFLEEHIGDLEGESLSVAKGVEIREEETGENDGKETGENDGKEAEDGKLWDAGCFIEGSKKVGLLNVKFEEHKKEWVPVSLHVEMLEKTGQVVSDISGSLPYGIKNFTRLSK